MFSLGFSSGFCGLIGLFLWAFLGLDTGSIRVRQVSFNRLL